MRQFREWLATFGDAASIAGLFGVSIIAIVSGLSGLWAHAEKLRTSYIIVISLIVFVGCLWSWIGLVWLFDRAKKPSLTGLEKTGSEYAWGLIVEGAFLGFDTPDRPIASQISLTIKNRLMLPIKYELVSLKIEIDHKTPDIDIGPAVPGILMPNNFHVLNSKGYSLGKIDPQKELSGTIELVMNYGHPDESPTRRMSRWFKFELKLGPHPMQALLPNMPGPPPPVLGKFPLSLGFSKLDEDIPYLSLRS